MSHRHIKYLYWIVTNLSGVRKEIPCHQLNQTMYLQKNSQTSSWIRSKRYRIICIYDLFEMATNESITMREIFLPPSELEVHKSVMKMQTKSHEHDIIPTKLLKEYIEKLKELLTNIVNISW